ncbi:MAG: HlyD family efflux transporter periplasmic adaptor subunit [Acutalibacteraceae bacterium]|nr:HlyD family efflux transporter periplasmic adaptor subunit [Acutalibacteraceae bacterium]
MKRKKTSTGSKLKYIIPILIAVILIYVFVSMLTTSFSMVHVEAAQYETVSKVLKSEAYIFRQESYITNDNGGVLHYNVNDCSSVALNGIIANVYETETDAISITKIDEINKEIENIKKLSAMTKVTGTSLEAINSSLNDQLTDFIIDVQNNDLTRAKSTMGDLLHSLNSKQVTTGKNIDFNARLNELQTQLDSLLQTTKPAIAQISSQKSGVFTSQTDGCELLYDYQKVPAITYSELARVKDTPPQEIPLNVIGNVISDVNWYICCPMTSKEAEEFKEIYDMVNINIPYASADTLTARVVAVNDDAKTGNAVVVLECENMNNTLAKIRSEEVDISVRTYSGIKVDKTAVHKDKVTTTKENADGTTSTVEKIVEGVYILYGNELKFKEIIKLYETDQYVICDTDQENEKLFSGSTIKLYDKIVTEGTDLYAGKIVKQSTKIE